MVPIASNKKEFKIEIPEKAEEILRRLHEAGYEAYVVGGCVRDSLLGRTPGDWDITTSAKPEETKALFRRTIDTGIQHGTVTVMMDKEGFEVTTYRIDGEYTDARHPKDVVFTSDLIEDLKRRDFTINAMAYNEEDGLVDAFDGIGDLNRHMIRCVGKAEERFSEDALRMLRAVRFAAQLDFEIETETQEAVQKLAPTISKISKERIQTELVKLLCSDHPGRLRNAYELGITKVILPDFDVCMVTDQNNPHHCYTVGEHIVVSVEQIRKDKWLRLAMLLHDIAKPATKTTDADGIDHFHGHPAKSAEMAAKILRDLKFDNETIKHVTNLVRHHDLFMGMEKVDDPKVRRAINEIGKEDFSLLLEVKRADVLAQSDFGRERKLAALQGLKESYDRILENGDPLFIKDLAVGGGDLRQAGVPSGPLMGQTLQAMLEDVLRVPSHNTKEYLLGRKWV